MIKIVRNFKITYENFICVIDGKYKIEISDEVKERLDDIIDFIKELLKQNTKVYGITTGFADLRDKIVSSEDSCKLSENIIKSHDVGIGKPLEKNIVKGAMFLRLVSLCRGYSAIQYTTIKLLTDMINNDIIPIIPFSGSLGASGDLCLLARMSRALIGEDIKLYNGIRVKEAFKMYNLSPVKLSSKEGLALTNGTSFSTSQAIFAFLEMEKYFNRAIHLISLLLSGVDTVKDAFTESINDIRGQEGQTIIAKKLTQLLEKHKSNPETIQNDYSIRCLPQILGPLYEEIGKSKKILCNEMNAVTDNPLIYKNEEISKDVSENRIFKIKNNKFSVLSGGNFHGEYITRVCDNLRTCLVKTVLTMERQITFILNPNRHGLKNIPIYLIVDEKNIGLKSGFMIVQYTANSLAQKISKLGIPDSIFNITSANESEDVVSYSMSSAQSLYEQVNYFDEFLTLYSCVAVQVVSITKPELCEILKNIYDSYQIGLKYPRLEDESFENDIEIIQKNNDKIDEIINTMKNNQSTQKISNYDCIGGTRDFLPDDMKLRNWLMKIWKQTAYKFGFEEYDVPILEPFELYSRKNGEDIEKEMYVFKDNGGKKLALTPELTPSLARLVLKNGSKSKFPLRWSAIGNCWRYESNTKTRKRQFFQWNMDMIGIDSRISEAELLLSIIHFLKEVGIEEGEIEIRINSRKIMQTFLDSIEVKELTQICLIIDKILKVEESLILEMLEELGISKENCIKIIEFSKCKDIESLLNNFPKTKGAVEEIIELFEILDEYKKWIKFDTGIIRGLSYYTGMVFEVYSVKTEIQRAIAGGGSYNKLFSIFENDKDIPCVGFGLGDVVIIELLKELKKIPIFKQSVDYYIIPFDKEYIVPSIEISKMIRNSGKSCIIHSDLKMKKKNIYAFAEKINAMKVIFIAPNEWKEGKICVKDMSLEKYGTEAQKIMTLEEFNNSL
jgi:histidyl-tRNA synthetase